MPTSYTSLIGLALPATGELSGTWGDTVNNYITQYTDAAIAGAQVISGSQTSVTLSTTNGSSLVQAGSGGSTGSAQYQIIRCTGSPASTLVITAPAASKAYLVINATSTSQSVTIRGAGPTTGVTIAAATQALVAWNGSDFVRVAQSDRLVTAGGTLLLDASGNLGLGVTPSAWSSSFVGLQVGALGGLNIGGASNDAFAAVNAYYNGGWKYGASGVAASMYRQNGGSHYFSTASSGTAGNPITFTQAMTLTNGGNLYLGNVDDGTKITLAGANTSAGNGISFYETTSGNQARLRIHQASGEAIYNATFGTGTNAHIWQVGNVEVGRLVAGGTFTASSNIVAGGSSINIGNGTSGEKQLYLSNAARNVYFYNNTSGTTVGLYDGTAAASRWTSDTSGNFVATGNVTAYSDIRLKTDLQQIPDALAKVEQLTGYTYTRTDSGERQTGLVAQDVEKVLPEAVLQGEHLSLAYGNMVGLLVEAVKELSARVKELEAK